MQTEKKMQNDANSSVDASIDSGKRRFLAAGLGLAGAVLAPGVFLYEVAHARAPEEAASTKVRWGMLIDTGHCENCNVCVDACDKENGLTKHARPLTDARWIRKVKVEDVQTHHVQELPLLCQHCKHPPCVDVCPTGASFKRDDGIVLVDKHRCIGCRYCMMACPYKARSFVHEVIEDQKAYAPRGKGTVESCTFCVHRVDQGKDPACVTACATEHKSMIFGDMNDPNSEISKRLKQYGGQQLRADLGLDLGVRYMGLAL